MTFRPERENAGYVIVWYSSGKFRKIRRSEFDRIVSAFHEGRQFYTAEDLYGDTVEIRMEAVEDIEDCAPEGVEAVDRDEADRIAYEKMHGEG